MVKALLASSVASILVLIGCSDSGPADGLVGTLTSISDGLDSYFQDHQEYPPLFELGGDFKATSDWAEAIGVPEEELTEWSVIPYYGEHGYCIEGDDERGTWHVTRDEREPVEGECPE